MTGPIWKTLVVAAGFAVFPVAANAGPTSIDVQADLAAKIEADTSAAVDAVGESRERVRRHLSRAQANMQRAYRLTQRVNTRARRNGEIPNAASVTATFTAAVDANNEQLETLIERSSGRVETVGARALADNVEKRSRALLSYMRSFESQPSADPDEFNLDGQIGAQAEAFASTAEFAEKAEDVGPRAQTRLQQGLADMIEIQTELAELFGELYSRANSKGKERLAQIGREIAEDSSEMRVVVDECGHSDAPVESAEGDTTLGHLAVSAEAEVHSDVAESTRVDARGDATGSVTLPSLP